MNFYEELSSYYDRMISFESRLRSEKEIFENVLKKYPAKSILDAGCGSGYHSILLASMGKKVLGFDPSEKMNELAKNNQKRYDLHIELVRTDFLNYPQKITKQFDAIYTLGNSFVHLIQKSQLQKTLKNFFESLHKDGYVCIGIVNYDRVLKFNDLEISTKEKNGIFFHRYYTLNRNTITFNVEINNHQKHHYKTELYPLTSEELNDMTKKTGFNNIKLFGNLKFDSYSPEKSENIVAFLHK